MYGMEDHLITLMVVQRMEVFLPGAGVDNKQKHVHSSNESFSISFLFTHGHGGTLD
jgi:hypothetical protein